MPDLLDQSIGEFLDGLSVSEGAPGAGSVAAIVGATAAGLLAMASRASLEDWDEAGGAVAQAEALRRRLGPLAQADADVLEEALERLGGGSGDAVLGEALDRAAQVPLSIVEACTAVAELAAHVAANASEKVRADAAAAGLLAEAAARTGVKLVEVNLATVEGDDRLTRAEELVETCRRAARRAGEKAG